jgi:hypothetical protein
MKLIGRVVAVLVGMALLGAMGIGAYLGLRYFLAAFAALDPQVARVTGIACVVVLLAAGMIARGIAAATQARRAIAFREEKAATYQLFTDFWQNELHRPPAGTDQLPPDLADKKQTLDRLLAMYGGAGVLKAHTALWDLKQDKGTHHPDMRARFGKALVVVREDLGTDTPYSIGRDLERLLLPPAAAGDAKVLAPAL